MTQNIDAEIERLQMEIGERYDKLMCLILEKKYGVEVEIVDENHIKVGGQEMTAEDFMDWLVDNGEEDLVMDRPHVEA